jgi:Amidohydrolase
MRKLCLAACLILIAALLAASASIAVDDTMSGQKGVELPIANVHFHPMPFMNPEDLLKRMDRLNIRWCGGAGAIIPIGYQGFDRELLFQKALGDRYLRFAGFTELARNALFSPTHVADASSESFKSAYGKIEQELKTGVGRGIGEVWVNTRTSHANPRLRFKIPPNSSGVRALWSLSARYGVPLSIHMQFDQDSVEQLRELLQSDPKGILVLDHAGTDTVAEQVRPLVAEFPNLFCDLSYRSPPQVKGPVSTSSRIIFSRSGLKPDWKQLIEDYPDRFFVGVDDVESWSEYDEVVATIREGLLANLSAETAEKVAYKNAVRVFKLK